jgi:hypothetical protein
VSVPLIQSSFVSGEVAPSLLGRVDLARYHTSLATCRNAWPNYRGPIYSRAGTLFCNFSKQTGRSLPPRLIPFQFSINQGLALEFGNFYMRVYSDGAAVTESPIPITGASQANPLVINATANGVTAATANNGAVTSSYNGGDTVTISGGIGSTPAVLNIISTLLLSTSLNSPGNATGGSVYAPGDTVTLSGGTQAAIAQITVLTTQVVGATINTAGTGGTNGSQTVTGTTGTGTKFQANVTIAGNAITAINSITVPGNYTVNPTVPTNCPVTGASLVGASLSLDIGILTFSVTAPGQFTANAAGGVFTQGSTSGAGVGATFNNSIFGINALSVNQAGVYTTFPSNPASQASTSGNGAGATFNLTTGAVAAFNPGDWIFISGVAGMTQLNGQTYVVKSSNTTTATLEDVYGNNINSTGFSAYVSGGTAARIYTLATPYAEADLQWLKVTQSADVMSICCVNQTTLTEYQPQDLTRLADDSWSFSPVIPTPSITPPTGATAVASSGGAVDYQYKVTAISPIDGTESIASNIAEVDNAVNIASTAGTITITWNPVANVTTYYIYKATPAAASPPVGSTFGFAGQALGVQFQDSNIVADDSQVPPTHTNPFARGQILSATAVLAGSGYTKATGFINTSTGSGAVLEGVIVNGGVVAWIVVDAGENYAPADTLVVIGDGVNASATLNVGPQTGTYPSVPGYFQERRVYANTLNNPDTYFMSQPGAFTNFDVRNPTIASDAITGSPWAVEVNGIQAILQTSGGLLVMTGLSAWLLAGVGSFATNVQAISPSNQDDVPQAFSGCSAFVPPIKVNYDVIYVNSKGSLYYDLPYQLYALSEPIDLTELSSHLFVGYTIREHAWCEQPYKLLWAVRNDGILLSLTYYKTQQISGWARHDTNGLFMSVCSIVEPPVDALYLAAERFIGTAQQAYTIERMDNRIWNNIEQAWCVDCALALAQPQPNGTLSLSSAVGLGAISGFANLVGGQNYSAATQVNVVDLAATPTNPAGTGATVIPTIVGGVITNLTIVGGSGYLQPQFTVNDPAGSAGGSGFSATPVLNNATVLSSGSPVFQPGSVGSYVRAGGGIAVITAFNSATSVNANILVPFPTIPNSGTPAVAQMFAAGNWTMAAQVTSVTAPQLANQTVTGLADGNIIPPTLADATGKITLPQAASVVTLGLGFRAQAQSVYIDTGQPTTQGQRKKVSAVTVRLEASRDVATGANQYDGSVISPPSLAPRWQDLQILPNDGPNFIAKPFNALAEPLRTGDIRVPLSDGLSVRGQVCVEQSNPCPMQILALMPEVLPGDTPQLQAPQKKGKGQ